MARRRANRRTGHTLAVLAALAALGTLCACADSPTAATSNAAPTVTVTFDGASTCAPQPRASCSLNVTAQATDPDGDPLRYQWSGCATGTAPRATCTVERPGPAVAALQVSDEHGHSIATTVTGEGTNQPPGVQIGYVTTFPGSFELLGNVIDPDEGWLCGQQYCMSATTAGACGAAYLSCTCLAGLEVQVMKTASSGTCTVTLSVKDSWGQIGRPAFAVDVSSPRVPGVMVGPSGLRR